MADEGKDILIGVLVGLAAGMVIGYLTAPQSGKETREILKGKMDEVKGKMDEVVEKVKERMPERKPA